MKISTKGRYGLRAIVDLTVHSSSGEYIPLSSVALRQDLSPKFLEQCFSALKKAGILSGVSGLHGGYRLAANPGTITAGMVLRILEGNLSIVDADATETPLRRCIQELVWTKIDENIGSVLDSVTLAMLADKLKEHCHL